MTRRWANWRVALPTAVAMAMVATPAVAMKKTFSGPNDLRAFIRSTATPQFLCYPGGVSTKAVKAVNPSNFLSTQVYATVFIYKWNGQNFLLDDPHSGSPKPGGVLLASGATTTFPAWNATPLTTGYYTIRYELDFWRGRNRLGKASLVPTLRGDYQLTSGATADAWTGFTYCYVPPVP